MKTFLILLIVLLGCDLRAQSGQDKVMLQQIAALKTYGSYLTKGYRIAKDGLGFIGSVKEGERSLHTIFYDGLKLVNPGLRNYPEVAGILNIYEKIGSVGEKLEQRLSDDLFHGSEKQYIRRVLARVSQYCNDDLKALEDLLTDNQLEADDAQRLERIVAIHKEITDRYAFIRSFSDGAMGLLEVRKREHREALITRKLYNVNQQP